MSAYEVGLGDSPMLIAKQLTGDSRRYQELLAANPHKSIVYVGGLPTFAALGVGEQIGVPTSWLADAPSPYAQALAQVGLHPDNPDEMYRQLLLYLANPRAFKERDSQWPGARDNLSWWEDPKGTATLNWPFHGGKWYDNVPKNDAQFRAVFKVPAGFSTKTWLSRMWGFPTSLAYRLRWEPANSGFDLIKTAGKIVDDAGNFLRSIPGVKEAIKLQIDLDFAALGALINTFVPSPGSDILHGLANVAQDLLKRAVDGLGPKPPNEIVDTILKELHFLGDANVLVQYLADRMLTTRRFDAAFFSDLFTFSMPADATDHEKALAVGARDVWIGNLDPTLRRIIPPLSRVVIHLAMTGKVNRSDLLQMLGTGDNPAIDKILDLFGIRDSGSAPPTPVVTPALTAPKKTVVLKLPPAPAPAPEKTVALKLPPLPPTMIAPPPSSTPPVAPVAPQAQAPAATPAYEPYPR